MTPGGCMDLREYMDDPRVYAAYSKLVSGGKIGFKAVIDRRKEEKKCSNCHIKLEGNEKFCPECGAKTDWQKKAEEPVVLLSAEELEKRFKT